MAFKINIGDKSGKTYKLEAEVPSLIDKEIGQSIDGKEIREDLEGYEFEISGGSDKSGFMASKDVSGAGLKKVLLGYGFGMHKRPRREGKKKLATNTPGGLRLRKSVRGRMISDQYSQINLKVLKVGKKSLKDIFETKKEDSEEKKE